MSAVTRALPCLVALHMLLHERYLVQMKANTSFAIFGIQVTSSGNEACWDCSLTPVNGVMELHS